MIDPVRAMIASELIRATLRASDKSRDRGDVLTAKDLLQNAYGAWRMASALDVLELHDEFDLRETINTMSEQYENKQREV